MSSAIEKLWPFDGLNLNLFFSFSAITKLPNGWNFMQFILNIYDHGVVMHVNIHNLLLVIEELLFFDCLNFNDFSVLSHIFVTNEWDFMKLILNIYDHGVVMQVKINQGLISYSGFLVL